MKLLYNAIIYTLDPHKPLASAMVIDGERILALGQVDQLRREYPRLEGQDLGGKVIIPGLTDAHLHMEYTSLGLRKVDCETSTRQECLRRVAERAQSAPPGEWVLGHGWNQNSWPESFGSAADLDAVAPDHPVYLTAKSLHAAWANSLALRLAGLSAATPDPAGGRLGRDAHGQLDGILFESAMELVGAAVPEPSVEQVAQAIRQALPYLWSVGLTGVHDFDRRRSFAALQLLHQSGELRLRVLKSIPLEDLPLAAELGLRSGFGDDYLRIGQVKAFMDGALGPHTAAMFQPFLDEPDNRGMLFMDAEELYEHGKVAVENGLPLAVHAIGDRANHEVLEAFANLRQLERSRFPAQKPLRHRIEHVQL
ncbi:MAG: amidohydrolase, partial [Anaerolineales bacterium]|nr:amidohydrolase [Anaerolineales bacterium]